MNKANLGIPTGDNVGKEIAGVLDTDDTAIEFDSTSNHGRNLAREAANNVRNTLINDYVCVCVHTKSWLTRS